MAAQFISRGLALFNNIQTRGNAIIAGTFGVTGVAGFTGGIKPGAGATVKAFNHGTLSVVHGSILPNSMGTVSIEVAGLGANDLMLMNTAGTASITNRLAFAGCAPKAGTVDVLLSNGTAGTVAPGTFVMPYIHVDMT